MLLSGDRLSLQDEQTIHATVGRLKQTRPLDVFLYACVFVVILELAGTVALFSLVQEANAYADTWQTLREAVFHSVSAFCNAGISSYQDNLAHWRDHPAILAVIAILVILGGIGLMTLINLRFFYFWRRDPQRRGRLTLQTRLSRLAAGVLLLLSGFTTWIFEINHTLADKDLSDQVSWSFFHSVMSRTAGFKRRGPGADESTHAALHVELDVHGWRARLDGGRHQNRHVCGAAADRRGRNTAKRRNPILQSSLAAQKATDGNAGTAFCVVGARFHLAVGQEIESVARPFMGETTKVGV